MSYIEKINIRDKEWVMEVDGSSNTHDLYSGDISFSLKKVYIYPIKRNQKYKGSNKFGSLYSMMRYYVTLMYLHEAGYLYGDLTTLNEKNIIIYLSRLYPEIVKTFQELGILKEGDKSG